MIKQEEKIVITFFTTTDAMAMESMCKKNQVEGRIIPVPSRISAGCGLAWCVCPEYKEKVVHAMKENEISWQEIHICMV